MPSLVHLSLKCITVKTIYYHFGIVNCKLGLYWVHLYNSLYIYLELPCNARLIAVDVRCGTAAGGGSPICACSGSIKYMYIYVDSATQL
jgi:hypothetical protein